MDLEAAATLNYDGTYIFPFDISCLDTKEEINNAMIDFYVKYLFRQWLNNEQRQRIQVLESVYLDSISEKVRSGDATKLNLLDKDFIVIPTRLREHWFLVVLCYVRHVVIDQDAKEKPRILIFDSAQKYLRSYRGAFLRTLRNLIQQELARMLSATPEDIGILTKILPHTVVATPQQNNDIDCGMFVMENFERFLSDTFEFPDYILSSIQDSIDDMEPKRHQLKVLIATLSSMASAYFFDD